MKAEQLKNPILIFKSHGINPDAMDELKAGAGFEDPTQYEQVMKRAYEDAKSDAGLAAILREVYLEENRPTAFANFFDSGIAQAIAQLIGRFGVTQESRIVDLGCGPGHLAYAMSQLGFGRVAAMDPNAEWFTGTGYLQSVADGKIEIINELKDWRAVSSLFDAIVSQGTVHHWQHIPHVAIDVRRTLKPGAFWFAFNEFFANAPAEVVALLEGHPIASRYGCYEWPYPASAYVDLIQSVGFNLVAVIPYFYRHNELLGGVMRPVPHDLDIEAFSRLVDEKLVSHGGTVELFWEEVDAFRRKQHGNYIFVNPQALVFQRVGIEVRRQGPAGEVDARIEAEMARLATVPATNYRNIV